MMSILSVFSLFELLHDDESVERLLAEGNKLHLKQVPIVPHHLLPSIEGLLA